MKIVIKDGVVTNDGAELGIIQDGICHLTQQCAPIIKGEIRKAAGAPELKFIVGEAPDNDDGPTGNDGPVGQNGHGDDPGKPGVEGVDGIPGMGAQFIGDVKAAIAEHGPEILSGNPADPKPARDPIFGNKCPKLLAWQSRNQKGGK